VSERKEGRKDGRRGGVSTFVGSVREKKKRTSITPLIVRWLSLTGAMISCD
jgi:molybdopterin synthase catalytic subunit